MQVRIGIVQSPREVDLDLADDEDSEALIARITEAVSGAGNGDGGAGMLWLTDKRGKRVGVATAKIGYVEVGAEQGDRRVGFSAL